MLNFSQKGNARNVLGRSLAALSLWLFTQILPSPVNAQTIQDSNVHGWLMYFGDHPVSDRWGVHLEAQFRRTNGGLAPQQLLLRPAVNYTINSHLMLTGGYGYVRTSRYGDFPPAAAFPEHRLFEQALIKHKWGVLGIQHRLRLEQRLVGSVPAPDADVESWQTRNRFRYMLRGDIPLPFGSPGNRRFGVGLYDEVFYQFGANRGARYFDQNRAYAALTYKITKANRLEFGYLHQYVAQRNGRIVEHNHTWQVALFSATPFRRTKR
ncbi:MAG: DUF2490 domain-containing protein [Bryobacteraceae bacterium]